MFEVLLDRLPKQKMGVYISENQPWEISLIYAWKKNQHGKLVAVPHTTVRYWDLRYFHDPISYFIKSNSSLPLADYIAVNGPLMHSLIIDGGYPKDRVVEVEALRFMHLNSITKIIHSCDAEDQILICGDFLTETNDKIFSWLEKIMPSLPKRIRFIFKAHPAFPYAPNQKIISKLNLQIDERPLENILHDCNIIVASAITSAGVDAYCAGKRVLQIPSNLGLNVNPLRGMNEVRLVRNPFELLTEINSETQIVKNKISTYFYLDPQLIAWKKLIRDN
jgi:surface carbohydrate biosynthesis protein (TIGR04326 family)